MNYEEIKKVVEEILSEKEEIVASYLYGSVIYSTFYEDIDVGLLITDLFKPKPMYEAILAGELEKELKDILKISKPVDVRILNDKPIRFLFSILKNSKIICSRDDFKRVQFEAKIMKGYLDIKPYFEIYDNMRELRYANK
ncbi:MAG: nucleotidyltransferase domain-containing protein [Promethearchaeota archaeon]